VGHAETLAAGGRDERPGERFARRVGDGVHEDVQAAPLTAEQFKRRIRLGVHGHIQRHGEARTEGMRQGFDALFHLVVDVGEGEFSALAVHRLRDAPRDRAVSRNAHDEGAFAGEKSHG